MKQTTLNELLSKKIVTNEFIQDYENAQSLISRMLVVTEEYLTNEKFRKFALNSAKSSLKKGAKATALVAVLCVTVMLNSCIGGEQKGKNPTPNPQVTVGVGVTTTAPDPVGSDIGEVTTAPDVTTADVTTAPDVTTADPNVTTADPNVTTADPNAVTTADPSVTTADPSVTTNPDATEQELIDAFQLRSDSHMADNGIPKEYRPTITGIVSKNVKNGKATLEFEATYMGKTVKVIVVFEGVNGKTNNDILDAIKKGKINQYNMKEDAVTTTAVTTSATTGITTNP